MPYDEDLAERVRATLARREDIVERKMFGGLAFLVHGNMCCGVLRESLIARVGPEAYEDALAADGAREMDFTGRPMRGLVIVEAHGVESDRALRAWVRRCESFVDTLPPK